MLVTCGRVFWSQVVVCLVVSGDKVVARSPWSALVDCLWKHGRIRLLVLRLYLSLKVAFEFFQLPLGLGNVGKREFTGEEAFPEVGMTVNPGDIGCLANAALGSLRI